MTKGIKITAHSPVSAAVFPSHQCPVSAVVAAAWLETLLDVIDLLPADVIQQEVITQHNPAKGKTYILTTR